MMKLVSLSAIALSVLLAACSGGSGTPQQPVIPDMPGPKADVLAQQRSLIYAYPGPGQTEVIPATPIALRFSHPIGSEFSEAELGSTVFILCKESAVNNQGDCAPSGRVPLTVAFTPGSTDRKGVVLTPASLLEEKTKYRLSSVGLLLDTGKDASGNVTAGDPSLRNVFVQAADFGQPLIFTTRAAFEGPKNLRSMDTVKFDVEHLTPNPEGFFLGKEGVGLLDFSTIRLQFTQPINRKTLSYGLGAADSISLVDEAGDLVPANVLVNDSQLSIDPDTDLDSTQTYALKINSKLKSEFGNAFNAASKFVNYQFTPLKTAQSSSAKSFIPKSGISTLLGTPVNQVPVASPLLGLDAIKSKPQATGQLIADLGLPANLSQFSASLAPLRVRKNSQLTADSLVVFLDGRVPAGLETDTLTVKMISDANGFLLPNRYSLSPVAPSLVTLEMDIAVSAKNDTSNGAFTQSRLHVPVSGLATFDAETNTISIDAVGTLEIKILGVDNAVAVLALKLVVDLSEDPIIKPCVSGPVDESKPCSLINDANPDIQSWVPGATINGLPGGEFIRPGDPMIVNFTKVMDASSFKNGLTLTKNGVGEPFTSRLDGASLVVTPNSPWEHNASYRLSVLPSVRDLSGLQLAGGAVKNFDFKIPALASTKVRPPIVLSTYPGYPCPIAAGTRDVAGNKQGRCAGGKASDDLLPLPKIEPKRAIKSVLSQSVSAASIKLASACNVAGSYRVEKVDAQGICLSAVPGRVVVKPQEISFEPADPWVKDQLYRYVLGSNNSLTSSVADCSGTQAICGSNGLPLQTQLIAQTLADAQNSQRGGPPMEIYFKGGDVLSGSAIGLRVLPVLDVNANFRLDPTERRATKATLTNGFPQAIVDTVCDPGFSASGAASTPTTGYCLASNGALLQPDRQTTGSSFSGAATKFRLGCESGVGAEDEDENNGQECQGNQFLLITSALSARLDSSVTRNGRSEVQVFIDPGIVVTSGADIFADLGLTPDASPVSQALFTALGSIPILGPIITTAVDTGVGLVDGLLPIAVQDSTNTELPKGHLYTGPLVFRMRYPADNGPIKGYIYSENGKLFLESQLDLYTDIPEINPTATILTAPLIPIEHEVRSNADLSGAATTEGSGSVKVRGEVKFLPDGRLTIQLSNIEAVRLTAVLSGLGGLLGGELKVRVPANRFVIDASLAPLKN